MNDIKKELNGDKIIWLIVLLLSICSILAVYSATVSEAHRLHDGNTSHYLMRQIVFIGLGWVVMYICAELNYIHYARIAPLLMIISIPLLVYTLFWGQELNNARRWVSIPFIDYSIQVSDFAKVALIFYVAKSLAEKQSHIKELNSAFLPILLPIVIVCGLIAPEDLSSAALLFTVCVLMMLIGRVAIKYIVLLLGAGVLVLSFIVMIGSMDAFKDNSRVKTWKNRVAFYLGDEEARATFQENNSQLVLAKAAIAHGGIFGVGPGRSVAKSVLPVASADFIFAIICEEYGLFGGMCILALFLWFLSRCTGIVTQCPKAFGAILAIGLCLNIVLQAFCNMAVAVELLPTTGLNLPMISSGGTSIVFSCMCMGVILSVSSYVEKANAQKIELEELEKNGAVSI